MPQEARWSWPSRYFASGLTGARSNLEARLSSLTDVVYTKAVVEEIAHLSEEATTAARAADALGQRQDVRDPAEVRIAQRPVRVGVMSTVQRVEDAPPEARRAAFRTGQFTTDASRLT